ncbi:MAG: TlpA family protein disulfide reductase [Bacteroides sp.]|nr:TlpA family protein disulfide reductase [Roseburia sp.]MCM1346024.1 TlpA family protein disulfide reductase [Bacteroides sp.]MCM1420185.1 TlpA family protein disulfide reductase [Bacteroides sp.]
MRNFFILLLLSLFCASIASAKRLKVIERPATGWRNAPELEISRIELSDTATVLQLDIFMSPGNGFTFAKDFYIQANGKQYAMKGHAGFVPGQYTVIKESGRAEATLVFPPIDKKTTTLDLLEGLSERSWKVFDIDLTGKRTLGEYPDDLPDDLKDMKIDKDAPLPEPSLEVGTTTLRVHLLGYRPEMGRKMNLYVNDFYPCTQRELFADVSDDGVAEFVFTQYGTAQAFAVMNSRTCGGSVWLKPGETADIYSNQLRLVQLDTEENYGIKNPDRQPLAYYRGFYANLNTVESLYDKGDYSLELYSGSFADYRMTADEYVKYVMSLYEEKAAKLEADTALPNMLRELLSIRLRGQAAEAVFNGGYFMEQNYRRVHDQYDRSKPLDYKAPEFRKEHIEPLRQLRLDSPEIMYTSHSFSAFAVENSYEGGVSGAYLMSGDTCSFLCEYAKVGGYTADINNMKPLTEEQEQVLASLKHPLFAGVCRSLQEENGRKIEEARSKTGYMVCDIPEVADSLLFNAIASRYKGKVVLVDFWATWCGPCREAIRSMEPLKDNELKDENLVFVYLTGESSPEALWRTMIADIRGHHYRMSKGSWNSVCNQFGIQYIPSYVLIQKDGTYSRCGEPSPSVIREALAK